MVVVDHPEGERLTTVMVGGQPYEVGEDGSVDLPSMVEVRTVARRHGVHPGVVSREHCGEVNASGRREGEVCGNTLPCQYHSGE